LLVSLDHKSKVQLAIVPLDDIQPHERTIPSLLRSIRDDMRRTGEQRDPILVDRRTLFAMDGMHRIESLRLLGAKYALCAEYDYREEGVKLERWLRTIIAPSEKLVSKILSRFAMIPCESITEAMRQVDNGEAGVALLSRIRSFVGGESFSVVDVYRKIGEIDSLCEKSKVDLHFATESEKSRMFSSDSVSMIFPARLSKSDVLSLARRNELLPYKTTRYVVPVRPMGIYYPLSFLRKRSFSDCARKLEDIVNLSKVVLQKRDTWYEGRRYSERIAIFRKIS
jgi:hypothetical protein